MDIEYNDYSGDEFYILLLEKKKQECLCVYGFTQYSPIVIRLDNKIKERMSLLGVPVGE